MSDAVGWIAAGLTVATFSCAQPVALRICAMAANLAFIAYAIGAGLWPVLALHAVLLPINLVRLTQARSQAAASRNRRDAPPSGCTAVRPCAAIEE